MGHPLHCGPRAGPLTPLLALLIGAPGGAAAQELTAPDPTYPPHATVRVNPTVSFRWEADAPEGTVFDLEVDEDAGFASPLAVRGLSASGHTLAAPLQRDEAYHWRVTARLGGAAEVSPVRRFTVALRPVRYRLELVEGHSFDADPTWERRDLGHTAATLPAEVGLVEDRLYSWRVAATDQAGNARLAGPATFTLGDLLPPGPPEPLSPVRGRRLLNPQPTFTWQPRGRVEDVFYRVQVVAAEDEGFEELLLEGETLTTPAWTAAIPLVRGRSYRWRVVASRRGHTATGPPAVFVLADRDALYRMQLARDGDFDDGLVWERPMLRQPTTTLPVEVELAEEVPYTWRVEARDPVGHARWTTPATFVLGEGLLPGPADPVAPVLARRVINPRPTFRWRPTGRLTNTRYRLEVTGEDDPDFVDPVLVVGELSDSHVRPDADLSRGQRYLWRVVASWQGHDATGPAATFALATRAPHYRLQLSRGADFEDGLVWERPMITEPTIVLPARVELEEEAPYSWRVEAADAVGNAHWTDPASFTLGDGVLPDAAELVSPVLGRRVINPQPTLVWRPRGRITNTRYVVEVSAEDDPDFAAPLWRGTDLADNHVVPDAPLPRGQRLLWRVTSSWRDHSAVSEPSSFVLAARDSHYHVQVAERGDFDAGLVWEQQMLLHTIATFPARVDLRVEVPYSWRVKAADAAGNLRQAGPGTFTLGDRLPPGPAELVSPVLGRRILNPAPFFVWRPTGRVVDTRYLVEVAREDDPDFAAPVATAAGLQTNHLALEEDALARGAHYLWRVTASWREHSSVSPVGRFELKARDCRYRVQVALGGDFDAELAWNRSMVSGTSIRLPEHVELAEEVRYGWRVEATDPAGHTLWSDPASFTLADELLPGPPRLVAPVLGRRVINPRPMLSWRPTGRALGVQYALEVARADDPGFDDPVVSEPGIPGANARPPIGALERDHEYLWRVTASWRGHEATSPASAFRLGGRDCHYHVLLARADAAEGDTTWERPLLRDTSARLEETVELAEEVPYAWWVRASDPAGNPRETDRSRFILSDNLQATAPGLAWPRPDAEVLNPEVTFRWTPGGRKTRVAYTLQVAAAPDFGAPLVHQIGIGELAGATVPLPFQADYWWRVGTEWDGRTLWSEARAFRLKRRAPSYDVEIALDDRFEDVTHTALLVPAESYELPLLAALKEHVPHWWRVTAEDVAGHRVPSDEAFTMEVGRDWDYVRPGGLQATYFDGIDFDEALVTRVEPVIDQPAESDGDAFGDFDTAVGPDTFSARWEGYVLADAAEEHTFHATASDGQRLWVAGELLIDDWEQHNPVTRSAGVHLGAGWHPIRYEFFEAFGPAVARVEYESPSVVRQVIPADHLATNRVDERPPTITDVYVDGVTPDAAVVVFSADEPVHGRVAYGREQAYDRQSEGGPQRTVRLTGLQPGTHYHYELTVEDVAGNLASSEDLVFCTPGPEDVVSGLIEATYHRGTELSDPVRVRREPTIDQPAGSDRNPRGDFGTGVGPDRFSVEWQGMLRIMEPGPHVWYAHADDGQRLYVDLERQVNDWRASGATTRVRRQALDASWHHVRFEAYDATGDAAARLEIEGPDLPRQVLPTAYLGHLRERFLAPVIEPRAGVVTLECAGRSGTEAELAPPAAYDCRDPRVVPEVEGPAVLPLGETRLVWTAANRFGRQSHWAEYVTVEDTVPPVLEATEPVLAEATSPSGTPVALPEPEVTDVCDAAPEVSWHVCRDGRGNPCRACWTVEDLEWGVGRVLGDRNPACLCTDAPLRFPPETTDVTVIAADGSGSCASARFDVTVQDTTPPQLDVAELEAVCRTAPIPHVTVRDNGSPEEAVALTCRLDTDDEPGDCGRIVTFEPGEHWVEYVARDEAGNEAQARLEFSISDRDETPPALTWGELPAIWTSGEAVVEAVATDDCDAAVDVVFTPEPASQEADGPRHTAVFDGEGVWDVEVAATDDAGGETRRGVPSFGIDRTAPTVSFSGLDPVADPDDPLTWPVFVAGDVIDFRAGGRDAAGVANSGLGQVAAELTHQGTGEARLLLDVRFDPGGAVPPVGPARLKNLRCADHVPEGGSSWCTPDGDLLVEALEGGDWHLRVAAVDVAGNAGVVERRFTVLDWAAAVRRAGAVAAALLAGDASPLTALLLAEVRAQQDAAVRAVEAPELLGNALLYTYTFVAALQRAEDEGLDDRGTSLLLTRGAYAAMARLAEETADEVGADDPDVEQAAEHLVRARDFLLSEPPAHLASVLALENALFYLRHAREPDLVEDEVDASDAAARLALRLSAYLVVDGANGADEVAGLRDLAESILDEELYLKVLNRHLLPTLQVNTAFLELLVRSSELAAGLAEAQDVWVWVRNWQWPVSLQIRELARVGLEEAARVLGDDPADPADPVLAEARRRYDEGIELLDDRLVDEALELYVDARCLVFEVYGRAGFEPRRAPPADWGCPACVATGDCPR